MFAVISAMIFVFSGVNETIFFLCLIPALFTECASTFCWSVCFHCLYLKLTIVTTTWNMMGVVFIQPVK